MTTLEQPRAYPGGRAQVMTCPACGGSGRVNVTPQNPSGNPCGYCGGAGVIHDPSRRN